MEIVAFLISLLLGSAPAPAPKPAAPAQQAGGATVKVRNTSYGRILVDGKGLTLYLFTREKTARSRCYGDCAKAWPPLYTKGKPRAGTGAKQSLLGSSKRKDGRRIVTFNGHPVYHYIAETKPGQVLCQNVQEFGGTWLIVSPRGAAIR